MIELEPQSGGRIALNVRFIAAVLETEHGCNVILNSGCSFLVTDAFDSVGKHTEWECVA